MPKTNVNWKMAGAGGFGLQAAAAVFGRALLRQGFFVHTYAEFPSIIKGGHSTAQVRIAHQPVHAPTEAVDLLVCLDAESVRRHHRELVPGGVLVYDQSEVPSQPAVRSDVVVVPIRMGQQVLDEGGEKIMRNAVALGASLTCLGLTTDALKEVVRDQYTQRGQAVVERNHRLIEAGQRVAAAFPQARVGWHPRPRRSGQRLLLAGNQAIGLGAIQAGCQFYSGYPMTPSTSLLKFLASLGAAHGLVVRQEQDEIAVINQGIGASFAGVRAMVGSAGGGFSLMVEAYGLAAMTETPLVIVEAMRPGPATGLPTWTEQGDLQFVLHAGQGEFPRVVLAPGSVEECFQLTYLAFNLADRYQTPVIVLTDKFLGESQWTLPSLPEPRLPIDRGSVLARPPAGYQRYAVTPDGVSPRVLPGTPGAWYIANSDEHDPVGLSNEERDVRLAQMDKRLKKLAGVKREVPAPVVWGPRRADLTVLTWGSSVQPVREALEILAEQGQRVNAIQVAAMSPFPVDAVTKLLASAQRLVAVEANATGQFQALVREQTGVTIEHRCRRYDGRPFDPAQLAQELRAYV